MIPVFELKKAINELKLEAQTVLNFLSKTSMDYDSEGYIKGYITACSKMQDAIETIEKRSALDNEGHSQK